MSGVHTNGGRTALVLGGGMGGVVAATRLRQRLPDRDRVVLIDRQHHHLFQPSLLRVALGDRKLEQIQRPLTTLETNGIDVLVGEVSALDPERKRVQVDGKELHGDLVIIALGASLATDLVPGLAGGGHNLYAAGGASSLHAALQGFGGGRIAILTAAIGYKCPAAPYEAAMLINDSFTRRGVRNAAIEIYSAEPTPMGTAGPEVSTAVKALLEEQGIGYHPDHQVDHVDPKARRLHFRNAESADYDLLIYVPPHQAPAVIRNSGLVNESGWVPVNPATLRTGVPGVFAIGDIVSIPLPAGRALPKAGVFAKRQAEVVASNTAEVWAGKAPEATFRGHGACFVEVDGRRAAYGSGEFYHADGVKMKFHQPSRWWHWAKRAYERYWLWRWF